MIDVLFLFIVYMYSYDIISDMDQGGALISRMGPLEHLLPPLAMRWVGLDKDDRSPEAFYLLQKASNWKVLNGHLLIISEYFV